MPEKRIFIVFVICTFLIVSGCVSPSGVLPTMPPPSVSLTPEKSGVIENQPAIDPVYQYLPDSSYWIDMDTIPDFQTGSGSNSTRIIFNITGTTNLPVDSLLFIEPYRSNPSSGKEERSLFSNVVIPVENKSGNTNTFFYEVNKYAEPGEYRVIVRRWNVTNSTSFSIMGKDPLPWIWIRVDPVGKPHIGKPLKITGTTNLPAGTELTANCIPVYHFPCPRWAMENLSNWSGTVCGNDCDPGSFSKIIPVEEANGGNNTWIVSADTTGWCSNESYRIEVTINDWDNVSSGSDDFRFQLN